MASQKLIYLVRRGDTFYFRRALPTRLISRFDRAEIKVSLQTDVPRLARMRCRELSNRFEQLVSMVERMPELTPKVIDTLLIEHFAKGLRGFRENLELGTNDPHSGFEPDKELEYVQEQLPKLKKRLVTREYDGVVQADAASLVQGSGYDTPSKSSERWDALCHGILRARTEQYRIFAAMLQGNYDDVDPKDPLFKPIVANVLGTSGSMAGEPGQSVGDLVKKYVDLHSKWAGKTILDNKRVLAWFCELVGTETPITSINKVHIEAYRDLMATLPSNYAKNKQFKGLGVIDAAKLDVDHPRISGKTADKYLTMLKGFLNWCVMEEHIPVAPGKNINVIHMKTGSLKRQPFSDKQLQDLFLSPIYSGCFSKTRRSRPGDVVIRDGKFWIPLVALFSGMRLGEIVQMHLSDVGEVAGIQFLEVTTLDSDEDELTDEEIGKSTKTEQSQRRIPIHPELVKIGFNEYLEKRRQMKVSSKRLFPDIKAGKDGYYSHNFSKTFSRYAKEVGVKKGRQHVFHSFRHNFKSAIYVAGIDEGHQDALMGHLDKSQAKITYISADAMVKALSKDIEKVKYDLDLSHLYIKEE